MAKEKQMAQITGVSRISEGIFSMWVRTEMAKAAKPGQFVSLYCKNGDRILPRPISICEIDRTQGLLRFVYRIVGGGTKEFASYQPGEEIAILGPLGNGFPLKNEKAVLIGGGIGIPPMLQLAKELPGDVTVVLGYRDGDLFLAKEFEPYATVVVSTEDGSKGTRGNVIDAILEKGITADVFYACGPTPMLRGVKQYSEKQGIPAYLSLEERMACGIGACLACVCQSTHVDEHSNVYNKRVCKDGPVFLSTNVEI